MLFMLVMLAVGFQPTSTPATLQDDLIAHHFQRLSDEDASVRHESRKALMSLPRSDLSKLREITRDNRPLTPNVLAVLHEVVVHVFARGEPLDSELTTTPMLGVQLKAIPVSDDEDSAPSCVQARTPGFVGFQVLRDGDILLDIAERRGQVRQLELDQRLRGIDMQQAGMLPFVAVLRTMRAGDIAHITVERGGQEIVVEIKLDAAPALNDTDRLIAMQQRVAKAEEFWEQSFAPLLKKE